VLLSLQVFAHFSTTPFALELFLLNGNPLMSHPFIRKRKGTCHQLPTNIVLSIISKVLGRCVCIKFYDHVRVMINDAQYGFLHGRSCVTQLLTTLHRIGQLLDNNIQTDIIFLDFTKAFDSVDHNIQLMKLRMHGISGNLDDWFSSYLRGRTQRVVVEDVASKWPLVNSGVPQGSILVPMLFLLFINDLPDAIPQVTSTGLYADDAKLYKAITSNEDSACLQTALSCTGVWSVDSNITFNTSKCKIMTISRRRSPLVANYHLGSVDFKRADSEVDLGITLTSNLCWNTDISQIVGKANIMLGLLRRINMSPPNSLQCSAHIVSLHGKIYPIYVTLQKSGHRRSITTKRCWREFKVAPQDGSSKRET
jgi:hypothetical protein